jgi:hypothetical protein
MRFSILVIVGLLISGSAMALEQDKPYTSLCIGEKSTGFNWTNGKWVKANFDPEKYLAVKLQIEPVTKGNPLPESGYCARDIKDQNPWNTDIGEFRSGCYNFRHFGSDIFGHESEVCTEIWRINGPEKNLESVHCNKKKLTFAPNGNFIYPLIHTNINPEPIRKNKDSLVISVGKCSVIK